MTSNLHRKAIELLEAFESSNLFFLLLSCVWKFLNIRSTENWFVCFVIVFSIISFDYFFKFQVLHRKQFYVKCCIENIFHYFFSVCQLLCREIVYMKVSYGLHFFYSCFVFIFN